MFSRITNRYRKIVSNKMQLLKILWSAGEVIRRVLGCAVSEVMSLVSLMLADCLPVVLLM